MKTAALLSRDALPRHGLAICDLGDPGPRRQARGPVQHRTCPTRLRVAALQGPPAPRGFSFIVFGDKVGLGCLRTPRHALPATSPLIGHFLAVCSSRSKAAWGGFPPAGRWTPGRPRTGSALRPKPGAPGIWRLTPLPGKVWPQTWARGGRGAAAKTQGRRCGLGDARRGEGTAQDSRASPHRACARAHTISC